jgi:hypothetical protein
MSETGLLPAGTRPLCWCGADADVTHVHFHQQPGYAPSVYPPFVTEGLFEYVPPAPTVRLTLSSTSSYVYNLGAP